MMKKSNLLLKIFNSYNLFILFNFSTSFTFFEKNMSMIICAAVPQDSLRIHFKRGVV